MAFRFMRPKAAIQKRTQEEQETLDRIENYLETETEEPLRILVRFWKAQGTVFTYKEIRRILIEEEFPETLVRQWQQDYSKLVTEHFAHRWKSAIADGAEQNPNIQNIEFDFDLSQGRILRWIQKQGAEFVTNCTNEQKEALKVFLQRSVLENMGTNELARLIRPCIGLNRPQTQANLRYYQNIKASLLSEHPKMRKTTAERKAREAAIKYAEKQHRQRAYTVAQTEIATAYNYGADEAIIQAQNDGLMGKMKRKWITSGDDKVCPLCMALNGMEIEMDENFNSLFLDGRLDEKLKQSMFKNAKVPPAHPHCACGVMYEEAD